MTKDIQVAADVIASGRVVAFPTGTSYGLAADALQGHALQRLRNLKGRDVEKTFTIFLRENVWNEFLQLTDDERNFLHKHKNQAITLLVKPVPAFEYLAQDGRIGLRVIDHPVMESLAQAVSVPLTATSANISGTPACYDIECIQQNFPGLLDPADTRHGDITRAGHTTYDLSLGAILDAGVLPTEGVSTIIRLADDGAPVIIRPGNVTV